MDACKIENENKLSFSNMSILILIGRFTDNFAMPLFTIPLKGHFICVGNGIKAEKQRMENFIK